MATTPSRVVTNPYKKIYIVCILQHSSAISASLHSNQSELSRTEHVIHAEISLILRHTDTTTEKIDALRHLKEKYRTQLHEISEVYVNGILSHNGVLRSLLNRLFFYGQVSVQKMIDRRSKEDLTTDDVNMGTKSDDEAILTRFEARSISPITVLGSSMQKAPHSFLSSPKTIYRASTNKVRDPTSPCLDTHLQEEVSNINSIFDEGNRVRQDLFDSGWNQTPFSLSQSFVPAYNASELSNTSHNNTDLQLLLGDSVNQSLAGTYQVDSSLISEPQGTICRKELAPSLHELTSAGHQFNCQHQDSLQNTNKAANISLPITKTRCSQESSQQPSLERSYSHLRYKMISNSSESKQTTRVDDCYRNRNSTADTALDQSSMTINLNVKYADSTSDAITRGKAGVTDSSGKTSFKGEGEQPRSVTQELPGTEDNKTPKKLVDKIHKQASMELLEDLLNASQVRSSGIQTPKTKANVCYSAVKVEMKDE